MISAVLQDELPADLVVLGGHLAFDSCEGARHHSPTPLILFDTPLWPDTEVGQNGPHVKLCGTCQANLYVFQFLLHKYEGEIPWEIQRSFGNLIRDLAIRGWRSYPRSANA